MKKETIKKLAVVSLFWGALWGIAEATLGYLAHLVLFIPGIAGFIMFPIGFYFMTRAYKETGKAGALFSTAAVAASIKLVDLFLPGLGPVKTINPAAAILMESLAVMLVFKAANFGTARFRFREALAAAAGWRLGFIAYCSLLAAFSISSEFFQIGIENILRFLMLEPVINAAVIAAYLKAAESFKRSKTWSFSPFTAARPAIAVAAFTAAVVIELILAAV